MKTENLALVLFFATTIGLAVWAMSSNDPAPNKHGCYGSCYEQWKESTGGVLAIQQAAIKVEQEASPEQLGKTAYKSCIVCHGPQGGGGVGPMLAGQSAEEIISKLTQSKNGETLGNQSALMWSQAGLLEQLDIENIAAFVATL